MSYYYAANRDARRGKTNVRAKSHGIESTNWHYFDMPYILWSFLTTMLNHNVVNDTNILFYNTSRTKTFVLKQVEYRNKEFQVKNTLNTRFFHSDHLPSVPRSFFLRRAHFWSSQRSFALQEFVLLLHVASDFGFSKPGQPYVFFLF